MVWHETYIEELFMVEGVPRWVQKPADREPTSIILRLLRFDVRLDADR